MSAHQSGPRAASLSATIQSSRAIVSLPKNGQGKKAQVYLERTVGCSQRPMLRSNVKLTSECYRRLRKGHLPTKQDTKLTVRRQDKHQTQVTMLHFWKMGREKLKAFALPCPSEEASGRCVRLLSSEPTALTWFPRPPEPQGEPLTIICMCTFRV